MSVRQCAVPSATCEARMWGPDVGPGAGAHRRAVPSHRVFKSIAHVKHSLRRAASSTPRCKTAGRRAIRVVNITPPAKVRWIICCPTRSSGRTSWCAARYLVFMSESFIYLTLFTSLRSASELWRGRLYGTRSFWDVAASLVVVSVCSCHSCVKHGLSPSIAAYSFRATGKFRHACKSSPYAETWTRLAHCLSSRDGADIRLVPACTVPLSAQSG